jgi:hypothetical protein
MTLQFERKYSTQGSGAPCHVSFGFFSGFYRIILVEHFRLTLSLNLRFDLRLRGYIQYRMRFFESRFPYGFYFKTVRVLLKTFKRRTQGGLGTTREDFKTTHGSAGVPSSLGMLRIFLRTFGLWYSRMLEDYSSRLSRLLETILLDYKVLGGLSYGPPWAHYLGGYQDRLLGGPLGLLSLGCTKPVDVKHKELGGEGEAGTFTSRIRIIL